MSERLRAALWALYMEGSEHAVQRMASLAEVVPALADEIRDAGELATIQNGLWFNQQSAAEWPVLAEVNAAIDELMAR